MPRVDSFFYSGQRQAFLRINQQSVHAAAIGAQNLKTQAFDVDDFVALGQTPEVVDDQAADRIEVFIRVIGTKNGVEIFDFSQGFYR